MLALPAEEGGRGGAARGPVLILSARSGGPL